LAFIVFVAYMSIFIPLSQFEAIVTIQVTALLSAVALYLALPKVDAGEGTTISDRVFLFAYSAVSLMIVVSILRTTRPVALSRWVGKSLGVVDANTAAEKDLLAMPHMTSAIVKGLIEKRPFASITDQAKMEKISRTTMMILPSGVARCHT